MGTVWTILKGILFLLIVVILGLAGWPWVAVIADKAGAGPSRAYVDEHAVALDLSEPQAGLRFGDEFYDHRLFMLSEIHGYADLQKLDLAFLRHLNEKTGLRVMIAELSPDQAMAFNRFVLDGEDGPARKVFESWAEASAQWGNLEFFGKLEEIRGLNANLPEDKRFVFVGVDKPPRREALEAAAELAEREAEPGFGSTRSIRAINGALADLALGREDGLSRYQHVLQNIEVMSAIPGFDDHQFYAFWGLGHGSKTTLGKGRPLAYRLNGEDGAFEGDVATVLAVCLTDCMNTLPRYGVPGPFQGPEGEQYSLMPMTFDNPYLSRMKGAGEVLDALGDHDALLVELGRQNSPYREGDRFVTTSGYISAIMGIEYGGSAADAYDAMIFVQGSGGLTPWRGTDEVYNVTGDGKIGY